MLVIRKEEEKEFIDFMDKISCALYRSARENILELRETRNREQVIECSDEIGTAIGQIAYDKVIELTKDMSREQLTRWFAQTAGQICMKMMNEDSGFRQRIEILSKIL